MRLARLHWHRRSIRRCSSRSYWLRSPVVRSSSRRPGRRIVWTTSFSLKFTKVRLLFWFQKIIWRRNCNEPVKLFDQIHFHSDAVWITMNSIDDSIVKRPKQVAECVRVFTGIYTRGALSQLPRLIISGRSEKVNKVGGDWLESVNFCCSYRRLQVRNQFVICWSTEPHT